MNYPANPYEVEALPNSVRRGLMAALPFAATGFFIPILIGYGRWFTAYVNSPYQVPEVVSLREILGSYGTAAFGCALTFSLAAILNYTPSTRIGIVRSLMFVGLYMLIGLFISACFVNAYGLYRKSPAQMPWLEFPLILAVLIPTACTAIQTMITCFRSNRVSEHDPLYISG